MFLIKKVATSVATFFITFKANLFFSILLRFLLLFHDFLHSLFRCFLNVQVKIPQHQLDIYTHATGRIGVDVLMEQGLVALYCPIDIQ